MLPFLTQKTKRFVKEGPLFWTHNPKDFAKSKNFELYYLVVGAAIISENIKIPVFIIEISFEQVRKFNKPTVKKRH
jgi:hypothetical protein